MDMPTLMAAAARSTLAVAEQVTPAHLDLPTPCAEWTVRELVNHLVHWTSVVSERTARKLPRPESEVERDYVDTEPWPAFFRDHLTASVAAWGEPGAVEGETTMMAGPLPAAQVASMLLGDLVVHGWDLAATLGLDYRVDPDVADAALASVESTADMGRQYGAYGAEVSLPGGAPALDRALALSGRDPGWKPA